MKGITKYLNYILSCTVISLILFMTLCLVDIINGYCEINYLNLFLSFILVNLFNINYILNSKSKLNKLIPECILETINDK